jgi:phosphoenolpyruvate---glycerone phosphotransferase subunit DhaK
MSRGRRQLVNDPLDVVAEGLRGLARQHPDVLDVHPDPAFVARAADPDDSAPRVALVSGGGSGHEPLHSGFVGAGMLDAAVPGLIFSSPTAAQVEAATRHVDRGRGVLHVVKNYTGDVMNFGIAAELVRDDGIAVGRVIVDDDLATEGAGAGRRGTAAVVVVEKACGAAAARGASLDELVALGEQIVAGARTMALAVEPLTHPGADQTSFDLGDDEVELGVGIHGERGVGRVPFASADTLTDRLVDPLLESLALERGERVIAIVNGLGATHPLELAIVFARLGDRLDTAGVELARSLVGTFVSALDMGGVSITLVRADDTLLDLWDAPVRTPALRW